MSLMLADVVIAQAKEPGDRTEEENLAIAGFEAVEAVKTELGDKVKHNAREHVTNKLLLALLEGTTPDPADVTELRRAFDAVENSPARDAILGS